MGSDHANWDGSLSTSDFRIAANSFAEKWNKFNSGFPEWSWIDCSKRLGIATHGVCDGYLSLQNVFFQRSLEEEHDEDSSNDNEVLGPSVEEDESCENATLICQVESGDSGHQYDFHVVYSHSYRVPVLYFRAFSNNGQPLKLDEIAKDLPSKSVEVLVESRWTFITQEEHPLLNRPWYMLHPCGTREWMKLLGSKGKGTRDRYLVSWLSVVGQVFGLKLPLEMLKSINL